MINTCTLYNYDDLNIVQGDEVNSFFKIDRVHAINLKFTPIGIFAIYPRLLSSAYLTKPMDPVGLITVGYHCCI